MVEVITIWVSSYALQLAPKSPTPAHDKCNGDLVLASETTSSAAAAFDGGVALIDVTEDKIADEVARCVAAGEWSLLCGAMNSQSVTCVAL
jgi:hypothetical protein